MDNTWHFLTSRNNQALMGENCQVKNMGCMLALSECDAQVVFKLQNWVYNLKITSLNRNGTRTETIKANLSIFCRMHSTSSFLLLISRALMPQQSMFDVIVVIGSTSVLVSLSNFIIFNYIWADSYPQAISSSISMLSWGRYVCVPSQYF